MTIRMFEKLKRNFFHPDRLPNFFRINDDFSPPTRKKVQNWGWKQFLSRKLRKTDISNVSLRN